MPFRETYDIEDSEYTGLFKYFLKLPLKKEEKLRNISYSLPENARYTLPRIKNEIIITISQMVEIKYFSLNLKLKRNSNISGYNNR